jgi:hypothetical protein
MAVNATDMTDEQKRAMAEVVTEQSRLVAPLTGQRP